MRSLELRGVGMPVSGSMCHNPFEAKEAGTCKIAKGCFRGRLKRPCNSQ